MKRLSQVILVLFGLASLGGTIGWLSYIYDGGMLPPVCLVGLSLAFFAASRLQASTRDVIVVILLSVIVAVYGVEILLANKRELAVAIQTNKFAKIAEKRGISSFDRRSVIEVVRDFRERGIDAYPKNYPDQGLRALDNGDVVSVLHDKEKEIIPLSDVRNRLLVYCNEGGTYLNYRSDEFGFHNPPGSWAHSAIDIALIGDSYTEGACVPTEQNVASLLRKKWPRLLNLGKGGSGPLIELGVLKEYATPKTPKLVVWIYYAGNDLKDLRLEGRSRIFRRYLTNGFSQKLFVEGQNANQLLEAHLDNLVDRPYRKKSDQPKRRQSGRHGVTDLILLENLRGSLGLTLSPIAATPSLNQLRAIMRVAHQTITGWGGNLVLVYVPVPEHRRGSLHFQDQEGRKYRREVKAIVREQGIALIDLEPVLSRVPNVKNLYTLGIGHFNAKGYALMARTIRDGIAPICEEIGCERAGAPSQ